MKKVSILSPCYNAAKYLPTFLDSIIEQEYADIELILVDDGSTDETPKVIESYKNKLQDCNISLKYLRKENGGLATAIAFGVKEVTGDYLIWPDPDDFLLKDSIKKRVQYLDNNPECAIVRSNGYTYEETDLKKPISRISKISRTTTIEDFSKFSVPWCSGCYMVRMSCFDKANPNRTITNSKAGQNIQMLIPLVFYYSCHYLDEYLYGYVIHPKSLSRSIDSYEKSAPHLEILQSCFEDTLKVIPSNTEKYLQINRAFIRFCRYRTAWNYNMVEEMKKHEAELRKYKEFTFEAFIMKHFKRSRSTELFIRVVSKIKRSFKL